MTQTLIIVLLILLTWSNPRRKLCDSLPLCGLVKYIAALLVVFGHLMIAHCCALFWVMESNFGSKAVSVFLFFSGYGLMHSYLKKGTAYLDGFVQKRIGKIILPLLVAYFLDDPSTLIVVNLVLCVIISFIVYKFNQWLIQKIHL